MPNVKPSAASFSLISFSDFLPKLRYLSRADAQLNFIHAHVEQLLELGLLVILLGLGFLELDGVLVVADEDIKMVLQDGRGLGEGVVRRKAAIRPDFKNEPVVVGALAHAGGFHSVTHAPHWREQRVNRDHADGLVDFFVFVTRTKATADFDLHLHFEFFLFVERADKLAGVDQFNVLIELDVGGGHRPLLMRREHQGLLLPGVGLEFDFL